MQDTQAGANVGSGPGPLSSGSNLGTSSNLRPYYSPGTFQAPLKVKEPSFNTYSNSAIISTSTSNSSSSLGPSSSLGDRTGSGLYGTSSSTTTGRIVKTNDYDYLDIGSTGDTIVELLRSMLRLYGKIFISQPWRVGRLISQVGDWSDIIPSRSLTDEDAAHLAALGIDKGLLALYNDENVYNDHGSIHDDEDGEDNNDDGDEDDDLYKVSRPHPNHYAYRSSSSLSFRSDSYSRRSFVPEEEPLDPTEEELDDEMSYFTSVGNDNSGRKNNTKASRRTKSNHQNIKRMPSSHGLPGPAGGNSPRQAIKKRLSRQDFVQPNSDSSALVHDIYAKFEKYTNRIQPATLDTMDIVFAIYEESGLRGMWRALNTSFFLDAFQVTIEAWLSGFFSSLFGVPDPHFLDMAYSPMPGMSLATAVAAGITTAVILAPVSIIRTRLMTTTLQTGPRSLRTLMKQLDTWVCPTELLLPTVLFSGLTSVVRKSSGFIIQVFLGIDRVAMPVLFSLLTFCSSLVEIAVKLPLETIVYRGHMAYLTQSGEGKDEFGAVEGTKPLSLPFPGSSSHSSQSSRINSVSSIATTASKLQPSNLIVRPEPYEGVFGTMWSVVSGKTDIKSLYRGWWWCIIGAVSDLSLETVADSDYGDGGKERF